MPHDDVTVCVADDYLDRFDKAVRQMEGVGLKVRERLLAIGLVAGSIDAAGFERLRQLPEVCAVERSRRMRLPHPEGDVA